MSADLPFQLPPWVHELVADYSPGGDEHRIRFAIELARRNVRHGTGGPFGAAVFERESGRIVGVGVNLVVPSGLSVAHAEVVALSNAQRQVGSYSLAGDDLPAMDLATSAQMCALCVGAVVWSGVSRILYGATTQDVQSMVGFDEGPIHPEWRQQLQSRGIEVLGPLCREEAQVVLHDYADRGGSVYNPHPLD